jgi:hypothetical protein
MVSPTSSSTAASQATMSGAGRPKTLYEKLEALPEGLTGEIIDGQLYTEPRPALRHSVAASNLGAELIGPYSRAKGGPGGWWLIVEQVYRLRAAAFEHFGTYGSDVTLAAPPFEAAQFRVGDLWT